MLNKYTSNQKHYFLLFLLLACVFVFQLWISQQKQYMQFTGGYDFPNYATLGRQLVEFKSLPTFLFPGKTFDAPIKPFTTFFPGILLGYQDWIPVLMVAVNSTLICFCCYMLGSLLISKSAGLMALLISGCSDPFVAKYAFKYAYSFDCMVLLTLMLAIFAVAWVKMYQENRKQPGLIFCVIMGLIAGLAWYSQPICASAIIAVGLFLLISMGLRVFTWRAIVVVISAIVGSLPFWLYWISHLNVHSTWSGYSSKYERTLGLWSYLFSKQGYLWFLLSPSGSNIMRFFYFITMILVALFFVRNLVLIAKEVRQKGGRECLLNGIKMPVTMYGFFIAASMGVIIFITSGMSQAFAGWTYGIELWFWLIIAGSFLIHILWHKSKVAGFLIIIFLVGCFSFKTVMSLRHSPPALQLKWENTKKDAFALYDAGFDKVLTDDHYSYMYFALGPSGFRITTAFKPWVRELGEIVEYERQPAVIAKLNSFNLGFDAWQTKKLNNVSVLHSFNEPDAGVVIPNSSWTVTGASGDRRGVDFLRDDDMSTFWTSEDDSPELEIRFEAPVSICRIVLLFNREGDDWKNYTYPRNILITGKLEFGDWVVLSDGAHDDGYFWDGGRIFFAQRERNRFDIRFAAQDVVGLKFQDRDSGDKGPRILTELYLFEPSPMAVSGGTVEDVVDFVESSGAKKVLADRYVSARVAERIPGMSVWKPPFLRKHQSDSKSIDWPWFSAYQAIPANDAVIISDRSMAERTGQLLREDGYNYDTNSFDRYVVFFLKGREGEFQSDLVWNGLCVAHYFNKLSRDYQEDRRNALPDQAFSEPAVYKGVAELIGVDVSGRIVSAGEAVDIAYYWKLPHRWPYVYRRPMVFSHLVNDDYMLSDDHRLLTQYEHKYLYQILDTDIFVERRRLKIPADAPKGEYKFEIGLHFGGDRVKVRSKDKRISIRKRAAWFDAFEVQ